MYDEDRTEEFLRKYRNIAVVGISENPERPSYDVASYLLKQGFNIIPINPALQSWKGIKAYKDLRSIPRDVKVEIIDIFRKPDQILPIVEDALAIHPEVIWMQEGLMNEEAAQLAKKNHIKVVMDRCMKKEHIRHAQR
ncbi:MAG: CoA-binding protein [Thermoplasmataceae archaeon]